MHIVHALKVRPNHGVLFVFIADERMCSVWKTYCYENGNGVLKMLNKSSKNKNNICMINE